MVCGRGAASWLALLTLAGERVIEEMIVEQGWMIRAGREGLAGTFEQRIDLICA